MHFFLQHWHGVFQHHTNYADGPAFVTQCPIVPNESFLYKFNASSQTVIFSRIGGYLTHTLMISLGNILVSQSLPEPVL